MKNLTKVFCLLFILVLGLSFAACGGTEDTGDKGDNGEKEDVFKEIVDIVLKEGDSYKIEIEKEIELTSKDESIVTVNSIDKTIIGVAKGEVKVVITLKEDTSITKEINVKVEEKEEEKPSNEEAKKIAKEMLNKVVEEIGEEAWTDFPQTVEYDSKVGSVSYNFTEIVSADGKLTRPEEDKEITGSVVVKYESAEESKEITVIIHGTFLDIIAEEFLGQFKPAVDGDIRVNNSYTDFGGTRVVWESLNTSVLENSGKVNRPLHDTEVEISFFVRPTTPKTKHYYTATVLVKGQTIETKAEMTKAWLNENFAPDHMLYKDTQLITYVEDYDTTIEWQDVNCKPITDLSKLVENPVLGLGYELNLKVTCRGESATVKNYYRVWEKELGDKWSTIELFLDAINAGALGSYDMIMTGFHTMHYGAVLFYNHDESIINTEYMTKYTYGYVNTGIKKKSTEYVVVHDTAGGISTHTAESFAIDQYNKNNNDRNTTYISWHYTTGEDGSYQSLPLDEVAYHAGDGSHVYGDIYYNSSYNKSDCIGGGNRNGIGIETCVNQGSNYNATIKHLSKLIVTTIFPQFENLNLTRVKQHYHFSGKDCPMVIRHCIGWNRVMNFMAIENFGFEQMKDVEFEWTSLSPDYLDENGNVNKDAKGVQLSYKVKVTYGGESKEYTYTFTPEEYIYDKVISHF